MQIGHPIHYIARVGDVHTSAFALMSLAMESRVKGALYNIAFFRRLCFQFVSIYAPAYSLNYTSEDRLAFLAGGMSSIGSGSLSVFEQKHIVFR